MNVIIETIYPIPTNRNRATLDGFICQTAHSFTCHLIAVEIGIEKKFIHHRKEHAIIFLDKEKYDVLQLTDGLGCIAVENIPSTAIEYVVLDE